MLKLRSFLLGLGFSIVLANLGASAAALGSVPNDAEDEPISDQSEMTGQALGTRDEIGFLPFFRDGAQDPTQGAIEQALGFYSKGSLLHGQNFADETEYFSKIMRPRNRGWATFDLITVIGEAAKSLRHEFPGGERLQIGDVASQHGGQLASHASHQNGLDSDLHYFRHSRREQDPQATDGFDEDFVAKGRVMENFDVERNWRFTHYLVETGRINRIFVDAEIKRAFCEHARKAGELKGETETLRRLRPWKSHSNHMHVRITCPIKSPKCIVQDEPPAGSGCDDLIQ